MTSHVDIRSPHEAYDWWPVPLPANVHLGERVWLYSRYAFRHCASTRPIAVRIGDDTGVYDGTSFDLGPDGEVMVGRFCTLVAPTFATNSSITIGDHAFIAHGVTFVDAPAAVPAPTEAGLPRRLGDTVWIGARATILASVCLGDGAIVGAGAVVDRSVPDHAIVAGAPARIIGWARPGGAG